MFSSKISLVLLVVTLLSPVFGSDVLDYSSGDFKSNVGQHDTILVVFFAPWCGHCKRLAPEYDLAAAALKNNDPPVPLAKVDCTTDGGRYTCHQNGVRGYPTIKIFKGHEFSTKYNGPRNSNEIVKYMRSQVGPASKSDESRATQEEGINKGKDVKVLGDFEKDNKSELQM